MRRWGFLVLLLGLLLTTPAPAAVSPDEMLENPAEEARARALAKELRCLVCQNQSIDDSDAALATDLRRIVRERILAGDTDIEIKNYLTARYGDFVLLAPPVKPATYLLWISPFVLLAMGAAGIVVFVRRNRVAPMEPQNSLSEDERHELDALLERRDASSF